MQQKCALDISKIRKPRVFETLKVFKSRGWVEMGTLQLTYQYKFAVREDDSNGALLCSSASFFAGLKALGR